MVVLKVIRQKGYRGLCLFDVTVTWCPSTNPSTRVRLTPHFPKLYYPTHYGARVYGLLMGYCFSLMSRFYKPA